MSDPWVTLARISHPQQAEMIRMKLESEGIKCLLLDQNSARVTPRASSLSGGMRLQVRQTQMNQAKHVLRRLSVEEDATVQCPECGSFEIYRRDLVFPIILITLLVLPLSFGFYKKKYRCSDCRHRWEGG